MTINNRLAYKLSACAIVVLAMMMVFAALLGFSRLAWVLLGLDIACIPIVGHLRMRETLAAVRRLPAATGQIDIEPLIHQLNVIEENLEAVKGDLRAKGQPSKTETIVDELIQAATEVRRESRLARIAAAQISEKIE